MERFTVSRIAFLAPVLFAAGLFAAGLAERGDAQKANACPVDGCEVAITSVDHEGEELLLVFEANFAPDLSENHIQVWWRDRFSVRQVSNNAETEYDLTQGDWHPTDAYPEYVTTGAASVTQREGTSVICVSPADRNHDILDPEVFMCVDVADRF